MTYIDLINDFWSEFEANEGMRPNDATFYLYLLRICNKKRWVNPFELSNKQITLCLGMGNKAIGECRDRLAARGFIKVTPGRCNQAAPIYQLLKLRLTKGKKPNTNNDAIDPSEYQTETNLETKTETNSETKNETNLETKTETNSETKNETNSETKTETNSETKNETNSETKTETNSETKNETNLETKTETNSETKNETNSETKNETISKDIKTKDYVVVDDIAPAEFLNFFFRQERKTVIEALCMNNATDEATLRRLAAEVLTDWQITDEPKHSDLNEAQRHLLSQIRIKLNIERHNHDTTTTKSQTGTRTGAIPPAAFARAMPGSLEARLGYTEGCGVIRRPTPPD